MRDRVHAPAHLVAFIALAVFATVHWAGLVDPAPVGRLALCVAVAGATGLALVVIGSLGLGRLRTGLLVAMCALAAIVLGLVSIGVPPRLLWPAGWGELAANLDAGLAGLAGDVDYPYRGGSEWSRLAILGVAPVTLGIAAILAFWPAGERARRYLSRTALILLVALFATASAVISPDGALARGAVLLMLVGAWLWLPALRWREALVGIGLIAAAGAVAVPAAAQLRDDPWLDYRNWTLRADEGTTYSWEHSYGPIDWPRDGTQMLAVRSDEAHYWKAMVLDRFTGTRWTRSEESAEGSSVGHHDGSSTAPGAVVPGAPIPNVDPRWMTEFTVRIHDLESDVVVTGGTPTRVVGIDDVATAADGTALVTGQPLRKGDTYTVAAYIPDPTAEEMRAAPQVYPRQLVEHTQIDVPALITHPGAPTRDGGEVLPVETITTPTEGELLRQDGVLEGPAADRIARSPYARVLELTRSLTEGQPTVYDSVRAIQHHLRTEYEYSEIPPRRPYPLASFLFEDRLGYCQQFSGAMALMLRMAGIPSRVVSGFLPGTRETDGGPFRVEDLDAHAWVEVYFTGIGWVKFDPTPGAAANPAQQVPDQSDSEDESQPATDTAPLEEEELLPVPADDGEGGGGSASIVPLLAGPAALLLALLGGTALASARSFRHRRLDPERAAEAQLNELVRALERLGWATSGGATLLELERSLRRSRRAAAARYVGRVRALRYAAAGGIPPSLADRRALRRELSGGRGPAWRLRSLLAIPPGGPRISGDAG